MADYTFIYLFPFMSLFLYLYLLRLFTFIREDATGTDKYERERGREETVSLLKRFHPCCCFCCCYYAHNRFML